MSVTSSSLPIEVAPPDWRVPVRPIAPLSVQPTPRSLAAVRSFAVILALLCQACRAALPSHAVVPHVTDTVTAATLSAEGKRTADGLNTIGILPFRVSSNTPGIGALGFALADMLITDLSRSARLSLVERARLGDVLRELDLVKSGRIDTTDAPRVGRLVRADRLLLGTLDTLPGTQLRLAVRVADVASGVVEQAIDVRAPLSDILDAEKAIALRMFDALGVTLTPAERALVNVHATDNLQALLAYGRAVEAELRGDRRRAADEFQRATILDPGFGAAGARAESARQQLRASATPALMPGLRALDAPVAGTVDRLNRPLDLITSLSRPLAGAGDPAFPSTIVTVVITVRRP